jgi:PhoH-like ATPase
MKKTYVLDTNVLLSDPNSIFSFEENDVVIPLVVLEELDRHKSRPDEVGRNARQVSRSLDNMRQRGDSLLDGVKLREGGTLSVAMIGTSHTADMPLELESTKVDNMIIVFMMWLIAQQVGSKKPVPILVSKDINVRIKSDGLGIKCEDYRKMRVTTDTQKFYRGVDIVEVSDALVDKLYDKKLLPLSDLPKGTRAYPNQIMVVKSFHESQTRKSAITRFKSSAGGLVPVMDTKDVYGLKPRNKEQNFSLDLLLDPDVKILTLVGPSGTGKTLLALAAGLGQLSPLNEQEGGYERIIVTRPVQAVGKDIGFLPGTLEEKMEPWLAPIKDNLNFLMGGPGGGGNRQRSRSRKGKQVGTLSNEPYLSLMQERGLIEIEAITYIRGRSIPRSFIVIDEAQNLSMHELKTIITRVGDGTKIVLTGDIEQIDNVHVDAFTNGLTYAVERFKDHDIAGHVTLIKGERSELATLASKIL